jgi:hypothetical protein
MHCRPENREWRGVEVLKRWLGCRLTIMTAENCRSEKREREADRGVEEMTR